MIEILACPMNVESALALTPAAIIKLANGQTGVAIELHPVLKFLAASCSHG
jgi:hypothetical protein